MKKSGFTLIELLAVIVLIGLLLGIGIPGINKIRDNFNKKSINTKIDLIESVAILWGQDNRARLGADCTYVSDKIDGETKCYKQSIASLIEEDYLDNNQDFKDFNLNSCVYVYKKQKSIC